MDNIDWFDSTRMQIMNVVTINIEDKAPTAEEIEAWREQARGDLDKANTANRVVNRGVWAVFFLFASYLLFASDLLVEVGRNLDFGSFGSWFEVSGILTFKLAMIILISGLVAGFCKWLVYDKWVGKPRVKSKAILRALTELTPEKRPDECISYHEWCEKDETLRSYHRQVAAQGRNPLVAEYNAAMALMQSANK